MPRLVVEQLSRPLSELRAHYDVIVVGSGYGGAIAACRLSRAGRSVALLERGRELHPGEYPTTAVDALGHTQTVGAALGPRGQLGDRRNLYQFHLDGQMNVLSGCGLGGTSLINAGVALRPDPRIFDDRWPQPFRTGGTALEDGLAAGFVAAEAMLRPTTYPDSFPPLAKVAALRLAAGDHPVTLTPINVTFRAGPNAAGVHQEACNSCGDCVSGCNVGAKSTVLMNYLPDAVAHGASVFTELEVRTVAPAPDGGDWVVVARPLGLGPDKALDPPPFALTAEVVVLAAGTLGTSEILLRSQADGLALSDHLGCHFSGNGDAIGFAERPGTVVRAVGAGHRSPDPVTPAGPCITAVIDYRSEDSVDDSMILEDAVIPGLLADVVAAELVAQLGAEPHRGSHLATERMKGISSLLEGGHRGATEHLQTFLAMGHDDDQGRLVLHEDHVRVEWPDVGTSACYERADRVMGEAAAAGGGTYLRDPLWSRLFDRALITVHPIGGCIAADGAGAGVVDHRGRVFRPGGDDPAAIYDGLLVADGSVIPCPLGVNPLLTISALAERSMALLCAERGWQDSAAPDPPVPAPELAPTPGPARPGLRFTERMAGWWAPDRTEDGGDLAPYLTAEAAGRHNPESELSFVLDLDTDDIRRVVDDLATPLHAVGTVTVPLLSHHPLRVEGGQLQLLEPDDPGDPRARHMRYRLPLVTTDGRRYHLDGFKAIGPGDLAELWPATSTLYATLRHGGADGDLVGRGVLRISVPDFARLLRTAHVTGPVATVERLRLEAAFGHAFAGALAADYATAIHRTTRFDPGAPPRRHRPLDVPAPRRVAVRTADGVDLRVTRYRGGASAPVLLSHGAGANPLTFSIDTVEPTLLEVLVAHGYDVWLQEWRASTLLPSAVTQCNGDQVAHLDHPACAAAVAAETRSSDLHVVAHCVGSLTWSMATLAGTVDPTSLLCSAVGVHPVAPALTRFKVGLHLAEILHVLGVRIITTDSTVGESLAERLFDRELRLYPVPAAEQCDKAVCRRLAFLYGPAVHHSNLDPATHDALHELFGPTDLTMMSHLSRMARTERAVTARGADEYLIHLDRLERPITFLHGAQNLVWLPESTARTFDLLVDSFGGDAYRRIVFDDYGHQDVMMGAQAGRDTFPAILDHLRRVNA